MTKLVYWDCGAPSEDELARKIEEANAKQTGKKPSMNKYDQNCGHAPEFRRLGPIEGNQLSEYCVLCALHRCHKSRTKLYEQISTYAKLHPAMPNAVPAGTKVILWHPFSGWPADQDQIRRLKIRLGSVFTVKSMTEYADHTDLVLEEFPGEVFNNVNFGSLDALTN